MVVIITGASHTGKTMIAQRILEKYNYPYLSIDHLKMGLIRSKNTILTPQDDEKLVKYLWPIIREIIKTSIENKQNLVVEGCYIPFNWIEDFDEYYLKELRFYCIVMSEKYINARFDDIVKYENVIEKRLHDSFCNVKTLIEENMLYFKNVVENNYNYILIDSEYDINVIVDKINL